MKIIFLDIDGVLNSDSIVSEYIPEIDGEYYPYQSHLIENLNIVLKETSAKIVVSSTWRIGETVEKLQYLLTHMGVKGEVIGKTDYYSDRFVVRGNEILKWIIDNKKLLGCHHYDFIDYVIIDDDSDMLYDQRNNFVHIKGREGLTKEYAYECINILNGVSSAIKNAIENVVKDSPIKLGEDNYHVHEALRSVINTYFKLKPTISVNVLPLTEEDKKNRTFRWEINFGRGERL